MCYNAQAMCLTRPRMRTATRPAPHRHKACATRTSEMRCGLHAESPFVVRVVLQVNDEVVNIIWVVLDIIRKGPLCCAFSAKLVPWSMRRVVVPKIKHCGHMSLKEMQVHWRWSYSLYHIDCPWILHHIREVESV